MKPYMYMYVSNKLLIKNTTDSKDYTADNSSRSAHAHTGAELNACNFKCEFLTTYGVCVYVHTLYMYSTHVFKLLIIHIMHHTAADRSTKKRQHNLFEFFSNV